MISIILHGFLAEDFSAKRSAHYNEFVAMKEAREVGFLDDDDDEEEKKGSVNVSFPIKSIPVFQTVDKNMHGDEYVSNA